MSSKPAHVVSPEHLNLLGNLALVSVGANSKFSNSLPRAKAENYRTTIEAQSPKLQVMAADDAHTTVGATNRCCNTTARSSSCSWPISDCPLPQGSSDRRCLRDSTWMHRRRGEGVGVPTGGSKYL